MTITNKMVKKATAPFATPYVIGCGLVILMLVVIPAAVLLPLNVYGWYKTIAAVTLLSTVAIWFFGVSPLANAYAGLAGGLWGLINDDLSPREGAEKGIRSLFRAITIASFVFAVEGMIAFFVAFEANPDAYLGLIILGVVGTLLGLVFKAPTKYGVYLVTGLLIFFAVMMLFGGRFTIPAAENITAGGMATKASDAIDNTAAKIVGTATEKPAASAGSVVFDIPAEGGIVVVKPGQVSILKMPADTLGYMNHDVYGTDVEKKSDSYLGFITEIRPGKDHSLIHWLPKPEAFKAAGKDELTVFVDPRSAEDRMRTAAGM